MKNPQFEELHARTGLIPEQQDGRKLTAESVRSFQNIETAQLLFVKARQKILDVNNWNSYIEGITAEFTLTDQNGIQLDDIAHQGMLIRIDIPGPGTNDGDGYDWAAIEELKEGKDENEEFVGLVVRPTRNPAEPSTEVSHFFSSQSTGSMILYRKGSMVSCAVYDRNLKANDSDKDNLIDTVRNTIVGNLAAIGISGVQWQKLTDAILE